MDPMKQALASNTSFHIKPSGTEVAALNALLSDLNNPKITGAAVPKGEVTTAPVSTPALGLAPAPAPEPAPAPSGRDMSRVFFTGKMLSGKDFCAKRIGAQIFGLADPLYEVQDYFFPGTDKQTPGARAFLQFIGQWGRGLLSETYPLTPMRALFAQRMRALSGDDRFDKWLVKWGNYGSDDNLWLDSLVARVAAFREQNPGALVAVSNVRFENEFKRLNAEGWTHFHVVTSPATWAKRLAAVHLKPDSPEVRDFSEMLARALDADVTKRVSKGQGKKLRVIWSDPDVPCPTPRFYTVEEFARLLPSDKPVAEPKVDLGEVTLED